MAHEYGHHVQDLLGVLQSGAGGGSGGARRVVPFGVELQADCFAGVWAEPMRGEGATKVGFLEPLTPQQIKADALDAASAVGDDRIPEATQGQGQPGFVDARLVGAAAELVRDRVQSGDLNQCNTFATQSL